MNVSFGTKIKQLRKAHGYDQNRVADHLGTTRQTVSMYERGCNGCTEENLLKLAELFNVEPPFKGRVGGWTCKHSWAPAATAAAHTWPPKHLRVLHPARRSTAASCHARTPAPPQSSRMRPQAGSPRGPPPVGAPPGQPRVLGGAGGLERPTPPLNTQEEGGGGSAGPSDTAPTPTITERVRPMCKGCVCAAQGTGRGPVGLNKHTPRAWP